MAASEPAPRQGREREDESEDESDILEESPCGRWQKRREQVNQGNMPGVQSTFLAMDTEEGVEVVWNELQFGDRKAFAAHEEKIQTMFEQLALVDHPNIVKLHKYWLDASETRARVSHGHTTGWDRATAGWGGPGDPPAAGGASSPPVPQVIFITEYVSSGSLKQFLKKTKKNHKAMNARGVGRGVGARGGHLRPSRLSRAGPTESVCRQAWKRWCTQILSALSFLHACSPPIIHGNLTSDTVFIQHNGLIKIGSGAGGAGLEGGAGEPTGNVGRGGAERRVALTPALPSRGCRCSVAPHLLQWCVGVLGGWRTVESPVCSAPARSSALPDHLRSPIRTEREEPRNLHFFPPEYGGEWRGPAAPGAHCARAPTLTWPLFPEVADGTAVDIFSFGMCALEMAVLEIQANGDTRVTEEAIARARHSLRDPNMREFILSCLARDPARRPSAHNLLFHRVLFEVHSLKLLAAHCFIQHQDLMPENVVEEQTKAMDPHAILAEIPRPRRPPVQWRYSEVSCLELDKFLEDVRNGIYPLMNFTAARPLGLPRVLAPPPEEAQKAKTPTPEPFDSETRKVIQMQCNLESSEDKTRWHLTLLLVLEDRLHRQLTYDLLPSRLGGVPGQGWDGLLRWDLTPSSPASTTADSAKDLAAELVHYGFVHEDDRTKLAAFLESALLKYRGAQP
ncbi:hypothetical protein MC885_000268 [Smutsia gigantea]|nr:hypothetical protein MC885_000268 [Smutsia gigantea]